MGVPLPVRSSAAGRGRWEERVRRVRRRSHHWTARGKSEAWASASRWEAGTPGRRGRTEASYLSSRGRSCGHEGFRPGWGGGYTRRPAHALSSAPGLLQLGAPAFLPVVSGLLGWAAALYRAGTASRDVGRGLVCSSGAWGRRRGWGGPVEVAKVARGGKRRNWLVCSRVTVKGGPCLKDSGSEEEKNDG